MQKITKIRKSVKAISPIIATLLLIAIAVVASLVVYAWVMGYIGVNTSKSGQALQIQSYTSGVDNQHVKIYVQNVGQGTAQLPASGSVYIDNQMAPIASSVSIGPGQTATIIADLSATSLTWTVGQQITVKVVASGGTFAQTTGYGTAGSGSTGGSSGPTITLSTSSGSAGSSVGLTGSGFAGSSTLTVTFNNAAVTTSPTTITSTSTGAIPLGATFTVPTIAAGLYTVTVTVGTNTASGSFTVSGPGTVAITITTSTTGAGFVTVGGIAETTPYVVNSVPGTTLTIAALSPVAGPTGTQYVYTNWSDGGVQTHTYTVPNSAATVTANFKTQYQVTFALSPSGAGTTTPATATWYDAGVAGQAISAAAGSGYTFSSWSASPSGSITFASSSTASTTMTVNAASTVTAGFAVSTPVLDHFTFDAISGTKTAGTAFSITIRAIDQNGNAFTSYTGTNSLTVSSGTISPLTTNAFTAGVWTGSITLYTSGSGITIGTTGNSKTGTSNAITVNPGTGQFGYQTQGSSSTNGNLEDYIMGSIFTTPNYAVTAQSITAYIQVTGTHTIKAAIYTSTGTLVAGSQEVSVTTSNDGWVTFTITGGHALSANTNYLLVVWANSGSGSANIYYASSGGSGRYYQTTYTTNWPNSPTFTNNIVGNYDYSIYCTYSIP